MIDLVDSFWIQAGVGLFFLYAFPSCVGRALRKKYPGCFAYGLSLLLAAGASLVFTVIMLPLTGSGGRGWGELIFAFVLMAQAIVGGVGGLMFLVGIFGVLRSKAKMAP